MFNNTPDETAFYRLTLEREAVQASMLMVQPSLTSFTFDGPPQPVLLDVASMRQGPLQPVHTPPAPILLTFLLLPLLALAPIPFCPAPPSPPPPCPCAPPCPAPIPPPPPCTSD